MGSVALAQQGLIIEPWHKAPAVAAVPPRATPASGLPPARAALPLPRKQETAEPAPVQVSKWSPPVVELLVDPWTKSGVATLSPRPRWVPESVEIVDPWANDAPPQPPRVASRRAEGPRSTIF